MTVQIINTFEMIQIDRDQTQRSTIASSLGHFHLRLVFQIPSITQFRQRIRHGLPRKQVLQLFAFSQIKYHRPAVLKSIGIGPGGGFNGNR